MASKKSRKNPAYKELQLIALTFIITGLIIATYLIQKPKEIRESSAQSTAASKVYIGLGTGEVKVYNIITGKLPSLGDQGETIFSMMKYGGKLFFGFAKGNVKAYNGTSWTTWANVGGNAANVYSMEVFGNNLYIGQGLGIDGPSGQIMRYNGIAWTKLGSRGSMVTSMKAYNSKLYYAGTPGCVKSFKAGVWKDEFCFPNQSNYFVKDMEVFDNKLFIGIKNVIYSHDGVGILIQGTLPADIASFKVFKNKLYVSINNGYVYVFQNGTWVSVGDQGYKVADMDTNGIKMYSIDGIDGMLKSYDGVKWVTLKDVGPGSQVLKFF
ncbi:MAG: hypothetical protein UV73_C0006G0058 [Candidatus Gottesmanbacteria bacterium GW2011_GWA2_43_14]|uniref:Uncharacterized protein n=1 Tax=Candidatus Gottesmanbacteria bacterium GW2011_GWA2_43_14 TaxID=1618443 RepID=A0A0G1DJ63_9BACT|nr:MAG: hypothetical protein UV73_C0006G0058 [Candidatus Gottesmanbacteria bacterium GW2011_GWA2_43_14]